MDQNKTTIVALSLCVLTLAAITTFLSLQQTGVLGETTTAPIGAVVRPLPTSQPVNGVCREVVALYKNYCQNETGTNPEPVPTTDTKDPTASGKAHLCADLYKLTQAFCPNVTPAPNPACKYGLGSFTAGKTCTLPRPTASKVLTVTSGNIYQATGYLSAAYTCPDGTTGTVNVTACTPEGALRAKARAACDGHGLCIVPNNTPAPGKFCTGDKDCATGYICVLSTETVPPVKDSVVLRTGKCLPRGNNTTGVITRVPTPQLTKIIISSGPLNCNWCGTACVAMRPGLKCPEVKILNPNQTCVRVDGTCKIITRYDIGSTGTAR